MVEWVFYLIHACMYLGAIHKLRHAEGGGGGGYQPV